MESKARLNSRKEKRLTPALDAIRRRGWRGGIITPHRAFVRLHLTWWRVVQSVLLAALGTITWIFALPLVGRLWQRLFVFWGQQLNLGSDVLLAPQGWGKHIHFFLPCYGLSAGPASGKLWWMTIAITLLALTASFLLADESLPLKYLIRALCLLQGSALVYFAMDSARFPHDLPGYTVSMLIFTCILIGLVPALYAFTFYLLDFSIWQKAFLTFATMAHLALFAPHQYILHVYVLHGSVLFMPVLYFVFGPFLDIFAFIGLYSWGMSWKSARAFEI